MEIEDNLEVQANWQMEAMYHKYWTQKLKRETKARHVTFVKEGSQYYIHTHFNNKEGGKDIIKYKIEGEPNQLRDFDYENLIDTLKNREQ